MRRIYMGEFFEKIPDYIKDHIKEITKRSGMSDNEESLEKISEGWLEKEKIFEQEISNMKMIEINSFEKENPKGALILTYSGSLINLGPLVDNVRKVSYASIGLRQDVPELATNDLSVLDSNIDIDDIIEFKVGPVKRTSAVYKISVCEEELSAKEQEKNITKAATVIIDDFVEVNKTIVGD